MDIAIIVMGIAAAFNIIVIFKKVELERYVDAFFDGALLILLSIIFGKTLGGMAIATIASAIISVYLMFNEPKLFKGKSNSKFKKEIKKRFKRI